MLSFRRRLFYIRGRTSLCLWQELGVSPITVSKWCRNQMQPTIESLIKIAEALEVDVRTLLVSMSNKDTQRGIQSVN